MPGEIIWFLTEYGVDGLKWKLVEFPRRYAGNGDRRDACPTPDTADAMRAGMLAVQEGDGSSSPVAGGEVIP